MKKAAFFLIISFVMIGCKQTKESSLEAEVKPQQEQKEGATVCGNLDAYNALMTTAEKKQWLKDNGEGVCEKDLYESVLKDHTIKPQDFSVMNGQATITKTWPEIDALTRTLGRYEKYISFDMGTDGIKNIILVDNFSETTPCFSVVLFRSIAKKNQGQDISFEFVKASVSTKNTVVINVKVGATTVSYYDYSDEPKFNNGVLINEKSAL